MKKLGLFLLLFAISSCKILQAQDTLPRFSLKNVGNNRIIIGWTNNFSTIRQISIQRSFDSLNNFKTILTVPDPSTPQNGYVDTKAVNDHMFYRIYVMLDKGIYLFSEAKKPVPDSLDHTAITNNKIDNPYRIDSIGMPNPGNKNRPNNTFLPSLYVYTNKDGYVRISLPDKEKAKKYSIKFFEEDGSFMFELKDIKERDFKIDKADFYHAGWFLFELYEDGKLLEKHKFYLEKEF